MMANLAKNLLGRKINHLKEEISWQNGFKSNLIAD